MADYKYILLEKDKDTHIARLTLNRPDRRNALNDVMQDELGDALEDVDADDSVRVLIITVQETRFAPEAIWLHYVEVVNPVRGFQITPMKLGEHSIEPKDLC